jgi:hypothetical protein
MACKFHSQQLGHYAVAVDGQDDYPAVFTCPQCAQEWGQREYAGRFKIVPLESLPLLDELADLVRGWATTAGNKFRNAKFEDTEFGRRFINHGGICYFNCATDLKKVIQTRNLSRDFDL